MKEGSSSFLQKRTKKLLSIFAVWWVSPNGNEQKFFGSFLQKARS
jgi:hypothetical protein